MKTIKLLLVSLLAMLGLAAEAQQVVVYKKDKTVETFKPEEADSVVYAVTTAQAKKVQVMKNGKVVKESAASDVDSVVVKPVYYYFFGSADTVGEYDHDWFEFDENTIDKTKLTKSSSIPWTSGTNYTVDSSADDTYCIICPVEDKPKITLWLDAAFTLPVSFPKKYITIDGKQYIGSIEGNVGGNSTVYMKISDN